MKIVRFCNHENLHFGGGVRRPFSVISVLLLSSRSCSQLECDKKERICDKIIFAFGSFSALFLDGNSNITFDLNFKTFSQLHRKKYFLLRSNFSNKYSNLFTVASLMMRLSKITKNHFNISLLAVGTFNKKKHREC